jgi:Zn-dependent protease
MFRIGRIFGHEINLSWTALLLALLYVSIVEGSGWSSSLGLLIVLGIFGSILVHELGHAVMASRLGYGPCKIVLHGLGGVAIHRRAPDGASLQISLAGPGVQIMLGVIIWVASEYLLKQKSPELAEFFRWMLFINLVWAAVNLLPIYPLDGGHVSEILLRSKLGRESGPKVAALLSVAVLVGVLYVAYRQWGITPSGITIYLIALVGYNNWQLYNGEQGSGFGGY